MSTAGDASPGATALNLQQAFKLALSMVLLYWLALAMNWDMPKYGGLAIALISLDTTGASFRKGALRVVGTTFGLAVGMLGLALFAQHLWLNLVYHAAFLVFVGYFMQTSRYSYAWFVAGYLPSLVWASTYGKVDFTFHYAVFRYLETTAGVVIYTLVCMVFWPRSAGDGLQGEGQALWSELVDLFRSYRRQLEGGELAPEAAATRTKLEGGLSRFDGTLPAAYADTPSVTARKRAWESLRVNAHAVADSLESWHQSVADCQRLDLNRLLPRVGAALQRLEARLEHVDELWRLRGADEEPVDAPDHDAALLEPLRVEPHPDYGAELSHAERAVLLGFVKQLELLDLASRELLLTVRVLAGLAPDGEVGSRASRAELYRPARWDPARLVQALVPAICFAVGYLFWIFFNPPTGPSVPNLAASIALALVLAPINAVVLGSAVVLPMLLLVSPAYLLVMPKLGTGLQLLTFIFFYVFAITSLFVGRLTPIRITTLVMFVMLTGISNEQRYSIVAVIDTSLMLILAAGILAVVQMVLVPLRPERILLESVRRFFLGCGRVIDRAEPGGPVDRVAEDRRRRGDFASMVRPAIERIQTAGAGLNYDRYPDNPPEKVQRLVDGLQGIAYRLQAMELAYRSLARRSAEHPEALLPVVGEVRARLLPVFQRWASLEPGSDLDRQGDELRGLSLDLERQLDAVANRGDQGGMRDQLLTELYALMGSVRGLLDAVASAQPVMNQIDWQQWAAVRF